MAVAVAGLWLLAGLASVIGASPASAQVDHTANCPRVFVVADGQLYSGIYGPTGAPISFNRVGAATAGYNALGYNEVDGMLYAINGQGLIQIDPSTGVITPLGADQPAPRR